MKTPTFISNDYKHTQKFDGGSRLVLGTSGLGGVWGAVDEHESVDAILYALSNGVEVIDTAPSYYRAEEYVGKALRQWKGQRPFISTKIGRLQAEQADEVYIDYSVSGLKKSLERSLDLLGVNYIDLLFLHEPQLVPLESMDVIKHTLQEFKDEGIVGMLGIGGNPDKKFWPFVKKKNFQVVSTFLKMDASSLEGFSHDIPKFREENLAIYAASALHMGLLGSRFDELRGNPSGTEWIQQSHINNAEKVKKIGKQHSLTLTNVALRYLFSMKEADRVVLGPRTLSEVKQSLEIWEQGPLPEELFNEITNYLIAN